MIDLEKKQLWFITGSQHLYGEQVLRTVAEHSRAIVDGLRRTKQIPLDVTLAPVMTTPDEIAKLCTDASAHENCAGVILWMHTFSPAKMWIAGLRRLSKPVLHLHTQFNRDLPWKSIDMDFMNLNQSAHGDREFGHISMRLGLRRKVVVGYWEDAAVIARIAAWSRAAAGWHEMQSLKVARFGDNMRNVAVTDGDKVEAESRLGFSVNGYGIGDLVSAIRDVSDSEINTLTAEYDQKYSVAQPLRAGGARRESLKDAARIELGLRAFLKSGGFGAFTDTFEDLHGMKQLPGIAAQRLMEAGYGFGGEGDWKTAALVRVFKVMAAGLPGGTSFMEDYTYDFGGTAKVLGAHMLEICPSIAAGKPSVEIHPLSIGGKEDPVRLVFTAPPGPAVNASLVQVGSRFRIVANAVDVVDPPESLPQLPVARALWVTRPDLQTAAAAWIYAGGAHHTAFSQALTMEHIEDFAEMSGVEYLPIDANTNLRDFRNELRWNAAAFSLKSGA